MYLKKLILFFSFTISSFSQELGNLLDNLNNYSNKTNLNIDYKPTAMTVLYASDLETFGINTLGEALDFIPGIQTYSGTAFAPFISVRGQSQPLNSVYEKVGFFIDGISIGANNFENFPISLIDRIEISKGSTFGLNNPYSFVASINIITKSSIKNSNNISFQTGSFDKRFTSLSLSEKLGSFDMGLGFYYLKDNKKVDAPSATLTTEEFGTSFDRKKESLEGKEDVGFLLSFKNDNFEFSNRYIKSDRQNNYGFFNLLDFNDDGYSKYETIASELKYVQDISQNNILESKIGFLQNNYQFNTYFYKLEPNNLGLYNPHFNLDFAQRDKYLSFLIKNSTFNNHEIDFGVHLSRKSTVKNDFYTNVDEDYKIGSLIGSSYIPNTPHLTKLSGKDGNISDIEDKTNISYYFNDTYSYSENLTLSFLAKLDDFKEFDSAKSFKLGTVYSNDSKNIYKFILSKSSKTPSSMEDSMVGHLRVYGNKDLKNEEIESAELIYIYSDNKDKLKLNLFYSIYKNGIDSREFDTNKYKFINKSDDENNYGLELEYSKLFENRSKLFLNSSYNIFEYKNSYYNFDINTPVVSKLTTTLGFIYPLSSKFTISPLLRYYGDKNLLNGTEIDDVLLTDLTLSYRFSKDSKLSFGAKNLFDQNYYYYGNKTKDEKMLREGRTWFTSFSYDF